MSTLVFCCGAECGVNGAGATPGSGGLRHWGTFSAGITVVTSPVRNGSRAYQFTTAAGATVNLIKTMVGSPTVGVARFAIRFSSLPSADCRIFGFIPAAGNFCMVNFQASDNTLRAFVSAAGVSGPTITTDTWYLVECRGDVSGGTRTMELRVDGTNYGTSSAAIAASTFASFRWGLNITSTTANATMFGDDFAQSQTSGDFPLGDGKIVGLFPNEDGTHNFSTAGDFQYGPPASLVNVAVGATDVWTKVDDPLDNITDVIASVASSNTEYLEVGFGDLGTDVQSINGVEVVMASHSASTTANKQTLRLNDNGTLNDVGADLDQSQTTITYHSKHYATSPNLGAAWTKTRVDALKARWNSSYGTVDNSPVPYCDALVLEVDYIASSGAITASETFTATESASPVNTPAPLESVTLTEAVVLDTASTVTDSSTWSEQAVAVSGGSAIQSSDSFAGTDTATATLGTMASETETASDVASLTTGVSASETESFSEARTASLAPSASDSGSVSDAATVAALLTALETESWSEQAVAQSAGFGVTDTQTFNTSEAITALLASLNSDNLSLSEQANWSAQFIASESGSWIEDAVAILSQPPLLGMTAGVASLAPRIPIQPAMASNVTAVPDA